MTKNIIPTAGLLAIVSGVALGITSCKYKKLMDFPSTENVYMPAAAFASFGANANGLYTITPTVQGQSFRYVIDKATSKFNVPLSVTRTAVSPQGGVSVNVVTNTDTVTKLIALNKFAVPNDPTFTTEILPATAYTLPTQVSIGEGGTLAEFNLAIDLNFIQNNAINTPKKRYALGVGITGNGKTVDSLKRLAVIFIEPATLILPTANFSTYVDNGYKTVSVFNLSLNGTAYSWNWGDGTPISTKVEENHKYTAAGVYTVTLTATGVTGATSVRTASITIL